ncbi:MAG: hypothetical protein F4X20_05345 [Dehalococcoidia bacterium]|nr:hypothetical protein [Dehalococcoidia bacterium]
MTTQPPAGPPRILPTPTQENDFYWEKCHEHELWLRSCNTCDETYFYPRDICPTCHSRDTTWVQASGRGEVHAYAVVHRPPAPAFAEEVPFITALIKLEEGPILPTRIVGVEPTPDAVSIGMTGQIEFEDASETISLPVFRPN